MNSNEAREHLEMVDRILQQANDCRPYRPFGRLLIVWGIGAGMMDVAAQLHGLHRFGLLYAVGIALLLLALVYTINVSIATKRNAQRISRWEMRMGRVVAAIWIATFVAAFAQPTIFTGWALGAIWTVGGSMQQLIGGFFGDRRSLAGAIVLMFSLIAGNGFPAYTGYILAAGFLVGYVLIGVLYVVQDARTGDDE